LSFEERVKEFFKNETLDFIKTLRSTPDLALGGDFDLAVGIRHASETVPADPPWLLRRVQRDFNLMKGPPASIQTSRLTLGYGWRGPTSIC
jgi:hypothetical protein